MGANLYRIGELAEKANVTRRTIHYYMGRGLLPPPEGAGLGTTYSDEHLYRIMLIKKLQDAYLPLDEIKKRLAGLSLEDIKRYFLNNEFLQNLKSDSIEYTNNDYNKVNFIGDEKNFGKFQTHDADIREGKNNYGVLYERIIVGYGVEIHFPKGSKKAGELAEKLYMCAEKILKEG